MFKKLKDKIAEEAVKISPQRIQQFTQSVTDRIGQSVSTDDNLFSIGEDDVGTSGNETGFSNVSLSGSYTPEERRMRRNSSSSISSDISFLPKYEPSASMYQFQSDLDVSASEFEDTASTSSQLGHVSKEQVYSAYRKSQDKYHKYRGRYTDLSNHYKELERENAKMKSVLVETQDKAIRRVAELKEQCALEQKAKAHLENILRVELDEKQCIIDTLKQKVQLLQSTKSSTNLLDLDEVPGKSEEQGKTSENLEMLTKYLNEARVEIENLNSKLQEYKANSIVFQSKDTEYKQKIGDLEKKCADKSRECEMLNEKEKENNLVLAQVKQELHNEIIKKDEEIAVLKQEIEVNNRAKSGSQNAKLENLQSQNSKLIEKVESLTQKCNNYENELVKLEQYKLENKAFSEQISEFQNQILSLDDVVHFTEESDKATLSERLQGRLKALKMISEENSNLKALQLKLTDDLEKAHNDNKEIKKSLDDLSNSHKKMQEDLEKINLENQKLTAGNTQNFELQKENETLKEKLNNFEENILKLNESIEENSKLKKLLDDATADLASAKELNTLHEKTIEKQDKTLAELSEPAGDFDKFKVKLVKFTLLIEEVKSSGDYAEVNGKLDDLLSTLKQISSENNHSEKLARYEELEKNHLELIEEGNECRRQLADSEKQIEKLEKDILHLENEVGRFQKEAFLLQDVLVTQQNRADNLSVDVNQLKSKLNEEKQDKEQLQKDNEVLREKLNDVSIEFETAKQLVLPLQDELQKLKEVERLKNELEESNKALQDKLSQNTCDIEEIGTLKVDLVGITDENSTLKETINKLKLQVEESKTNMKSKQDELVAIQSAFTESEKTITELTTRLDSNDNLSSKFEEINRLYDEERTRSEDLRMQLEEKSKTEATKLEEYVNKLGILEEELKTSQREKEELTSKMEELKSQYEDLTQKLNQTDGLSTEKDHLVDQLKTEMKNLQANNEALLQDIKTSQDKIKNFEESIESRKKEAEQVNLELEANKKVLTDKSKEIDKLSQNLKDLNNIQNMYKVEKEALSSQIVELQEFQSKYESILDENHNLKEQLSEIEILRNKLSQQDSLLSRIKDLEKIEKMFLNLSKDHENLKQKHSQLIVVENELKSSNEEKLKLYGDIADLQNQISIYCAENQHLKLTMEKLKKVEGKYNELISDREDSKNQVVKLRQELDEINSRNRQLSIDNKQVLTDYEKVMYDLEDYKIKFENLSGEHSGFEEIKLQLKAENETLSVKLSSLQSELDKLKESHSKEASKKSNENIASETVQLQTSISELQETKSKYEALVSETKSIKTHLNNLEKICETSSKEKQKLQAQVKELERQYSEICHEKQLLQDEVLELKTSPLNVNKTSTVKKLDDLQLLKAEVLNASGEGKNNQDFIKEIDDLRDKLRQYKSLDLTNRTSIEFYENELQKMKNKNEKLNRKLDETLVTLNHCTDLANTTEIEYLKNVLYNYMLGKESLVLARVIAAVCRFDQQQTEAILQKEQQKQTLLGQLGLL